MIEAEGWQLITQRGSHRQHKYPAKPGKVTIAGIGAIQMHLEAMREDGDPIPEPSTRAEYIEALAA